MRSRVSWALSLGKGGILPATPSPPACSAASTTAPGPREGTYVRYPAEELLNDPGLFARLVHPEDRERVVQEVGRASAEEGAFDSVFRVVRRPVSEKRPFPRPVGAG